MSISLYDISVACYLQTLGGVTAVLAKGEEYAEDGNLDLEKIVRYKLRDDMAPFSFQVISVWHHSMNAIRGLKEGHFQLTPRPACVANFLRARFTLVPDASGSGRAVERHRHEPVRSPRPIRRTFSHF